MNDAIVKRPSMSLEAFADAGGVHPLFVTRLAALGLLEPVDGDAFTVAELARLAQIRRLHATLPLNYAAVGVVLDLLDRIDDLEEELRRRPWT
jgi:chaperone modulatory protein CbpM